MKDPAPTLDETAQALGVNNLGKEESLEIIRASMAKVATWRASGASQEEQELVGVKVRKAWREAGADRPSALWDSTAPSKADGVGPGVTLDLVDPDPWDSPVDGAILAEEILTIITRHVALPSHEDAYAITLWTLHSHAHNAFQISPILGITSPVKRCGKTTLLDLLGALCPRPMQAANLTPAVTFRSVEKWGPTLLVDEADTFLSGNNELRGVLNSGHRRATAYIPRAVGVDYEPCLFKTWCPKAIALIGDLPDTLEDRSIRISMRRREAGEDVQRLRLDRTGEFKDLRRKAWRWSQDHLSELEQMDPELPGVLHDRQRDNWRPIVSIADLLGDEWPMRARRAAIILSGGNQSDSEDNRTLLLRDFRKIFDESGKDRLPSSALVAALHEMEDRPWPEWGKEKRPISAPSMARILKPFGLKPKPLWIDEKTHRGYAREELEPLWARYTPSQSVRPQGSSDDEGFLGIPKCNARPLPYTPETPETPHEQETLTPLTPRDRVGSGRETTNSPSDEPDEQIFSPDTMDLFEEVEAA